MKSFPKTLNACLAGPPKLSQAAFADRTGINKSKLSRLLNGKTPVDRSTLDAILSGVVQTDRRSRLVAAYFQDLASPVALSQLAGSPQEPWGSLELPKLSRKGQLALKALLHNEALPAVEKLLIDLAALLAER
jgi:transcriptional regulator with XRE-family HTH domain